MDEIIKIVFKKSRSSKFKKILVIAKTVPGFSEENDNYIIQIDQIRDYLIHQDSIIRIIDTVKNWKNSRIFYYGKLYESSWDFYVFLDKLKVNAGKYGVVLENRDTVSLGAVSFENLPLPLVFYPGLYGTFFAFAEDIDGPIYFCECEKKAIDNFMQLKRNSKNESGDESFWNFSLVFPKVVKGLLEGHDGYPEKNFLYKKGLCFRCNKTIPKKTYCHPMYGGKFKQHYGWYINQEYYKLGIDKSLFTKMQVLPEECTPELYDSALRINKLIDERNDVSDNRDEITSIRNSIDRAIENSVREQLGFRKVGDAWVSETMLYNIVQGLYPDEEIIRHHRPQWLQGLELDIYIPNMKLGFEYQGIQHFQVVEHWGGKKQLEKQQEHDARKKKLCIDLGVTLVCINYDEPLTADYISKRILESFS